MFNMYSKDLTEELQPYWHTSVLNQGLNKEVCFGNGGFSVRDVECMKNICNNEHDLNIQEPEDVFFSRLLKKYKCKIPSLKVARSFSCETDYQESIATHASHLYLKPEEQAKIYERHFINLVALVTASSTN